MTAQTEAPGILDALRTARDRALGAAGTIADVVAESESFGSTMARTMNATAAITGSVRSVAHSGTELMAAWLNLPTRRQVIDLASRVNHMELVLDDIEAATGEMLQHLEGLPATAYPDDD